MAANLGEITVERINVVHGNGMLRLVIANKDRMHPGAIDGVTIDRPRPVPGLIGNPRIEFLDGKGTVVQRLPQGR